MSRLEKIQQAILALPETQYKQLRQWFSELDWEKWDREIEADSEAGKLDFLIAEALEEKKREHSRTFRCTEQPRVSGDFYNSSSNLLSEPGFTRLPDFQVCWRYPCYNI